MLHNLRKTNEILVRHWEKTKLLTSKSVKKRQKNVKKQQKASENCNYPCEAPHHFVCVNMGQGLRHHCQHAPCICEEMLVELCLLILCYVIELCRIVWSDMARTSHVGGGMGGHIYHRSFQVIFTCVFTTLCLQLLVYKSGFLIRKSIFFFDFCVINKQY